MFRCFNGELYGPGKAPSTRITRCHPGDTVTVTLADGNITFRVKDGPEELGFTSIPEGVYYPAVCFYSSSPLVRLLSVSAPSPAAPAAAAGGTAATAASRPAAAAPMPRLPSMPVEEDPEAIRARYPGIAGLEMLFADMGIGLSSCVRAMQASSNNADAAAEWLFSNLEQEQARTEEVCALPASCHRARRFTAVVSLLFLVVFPCTPCRRPV